MRTLSLVCLLALAGCAGVQPSTSPSAPTRVVGSGTNTAVIVEPDVSKSSVVVTASADSAWKALIEAYQALEIPIGTMNVANLYLGNQQFETSGRLGGKSLGYYFDCGSGMTGDIADNGRLRIAVITQLKPVPEGRLAVETQVQAAGRPRGGTSTEYAACRSRGRLEGRIAELVKQGLTSTTDGVR